MKVKIKVDGWKCERCAHEWIPKKKDVPRFCPKCRSIYWDRARKVKHIE
jgi:Zn finger protein HypA/HybF involved in hydrogenase expression